MGKTGKKVKSDRINMIRKQYDAFLEDDKKRKDRNEYILGRLVEMQSSSALVKRRHKENSYVSDLPYHRNRNDVLYSSPPIQDDIVTTFRCKANIGTDCIIQKIEPSILREITKNFILIPKHQAYDSSDVKYDPHTDNADIDWKSKYNILNELKKGEKETIPDKVNVVFDEHESIIPVQESHKKEENEINDKIKFYSNSHVFDLGMSNSEARSSKSTLNKNESDHLDPIKDIESVRNDEDIIRSAEISSKVSHNKNENKKNTALKKQITEISPNKKVYNNLQNNDENSDIKSTDDVMMTSKIENELTEKCVEEKIVNELSMQKDITDEQYKLNDEKTSIPHIENNDSAEISINYNIQETEELQQNIERYKETAPDVNNVHHYESNVVTPINNTNVNTEINELEVEQNEMFYTENSENKHDYVENSEDTLGYPTGNEKYDSSQYSYQDEQQQGQLYIPEITQHEESTERYDPNYEQQYDIGNYENDMNVPQYDNQQYEVNNSYGVQQDPQVTDINYEEVHPNNENYEPSPSENIETPYENQEEVYNFTKENYEAQQYDVNEHQEYLTTNPDNQDQYVVEQEYIQTDLETVKNIENELNSEDGYIDNHNTNLTENPPAVLSDKVETSLDAT